MKRIRERRKELNLKLTEVAQQIGISKAYLSQLENGVRGKKINYELLQKLADCLETTPDKLVDNK